MENNISEEVKYYLDIYGAIFDNVGDREAAIAIFQVLLKDRRSSRLNGNGHSGQRAVVDESAPATEKQIAYLQRLGVPMSENGLTKKEASELLDKALAR